MLICGMLVLARGMENTGAARLIVESAATLVSGLGPLAVLSGVYLLTSILTEVMSNNAVAVLLTPIAAGLAHQLGLDPRPFVVAVMFAARPSFATPIGFQPNPFQHRRPACRESGCPYGEIWGVAVTLKTKKNYNQK